MWAPLRWTHGRYRSTRPATSAAGRSVVAARAGPGGTRRSPAGGRRGGHRHPSAGQRPRQRAHAARGRPRQAVRVRRGSPGRPGRSTTSSRSWRPGPERPSTGTPGTGRSTSVPNRSWRRAPRWAIASRRRATRRDRDPGHRSPRGARAPLSRDRRLLTERGASVITPADGARWRDPFLHHDWTIEHWNGVGMLTDGHEPRHTHWPDAMRLMLAEASPDLVIADHGFAGAAIAAGIETVSIADVNDPALLVAQAKGLHRARSSSWTTTSTQRRTGPASKPSRPDSTERGVGVPRAPGSAPRAFLSLGAVPRGPQAQPPPPQGPERGLSRHRPVPVQSRPS